MKRIKLKILSLVFASLLLISCDKKEKTEETEKPEPLKPASMLTLVPDDTIFFSGGMEPVPLKERLRWISSHFNIGKAAFIPQAVQKLKEKAAADGQRMAAAIWEDYTATMLAPDAQFESWGFEDAPMFAVYAIGLSPVLRISLKDARRFSAKIAALEEMAKIKTAAESLGQASYRRYPLNMKKEGQEEVTLASLVIGVDGNQAVFMVDVGVASDTALSLALGQSRPEKSLEQNGRLKSLQEKYKFSFPWLSYLDHQQIITGLTTKDGNRMATMVQQLAATMKPEKTGWLAGLQSEGCRKDLQAIGANWPQTVSGYTAFDLQAKPSRMDSVLVVESKDNPLLDGLKSLRGFTPDYGGAAFAGAVVSGSVGLTVENVGPFLMKQWNEITQKQYQCAPLQNMQENLKKNNPAAASVATSIAAGVRGLSLSLFSLAMEKTEGKTAPPAPKELDALAALSVKDPAALVQMVSEMVPQLAELKIPADGTPVPLPLPVPLPFTLTAAVNGPHLTVYAGEKAGKLAKELGKMSLESSQGIMSGTVDYGKLYGLLADTLPKENNAQDAEAFAALEAMRNIKVRIQATMDCTDRGIELKADMISTD